MKPQTTDSSNSQTSLIRSLLWCDLPDKTQSTLSGGGYSFPCDGPGRGGDFGISSWDLKK